MNESQRSGKLLDDFNNGKITLAELNLECAMWWIESFREMYVKPEPTMPRRYADYYSAQDHEKWETPKEFWLVPEIKNYVGAKLAIKTERESWVKSLKEFKEYLPKEDILNRNKYDQKIKELSS